MALRAYADGSVFAEITGSSSPRILALHGWGRRGNDFTRVTAGFEAISPDLPGFGASPEPPAVIGAVGYAKLIRPLLDEFSDPPVLLGHSFGGRVAVCLAAENPDRVGPLILSGVPLLRVSKTAKPSLGYRIIRALNRAGLVTDGRLEAEKRKRGSADYRAATGLMRDILVRVINESYEDQLRLLHSPVHLIWGENDREAPPAIAQEASKLLRDAGVEVSLSMLRGIGHMTPLEAPEQLRAALTEALER